MKTTYAIFLCFTGLKGIEQYNLFVNIMQSKAIK